MNTQEALQFLEQNQPMPGDHELSEEHISTYDEVLKFFTKSPDLACLPLFLNSFGDGDGFGVYPLVEDVILQFPPEEVLPHLIAALSSPFHSVRYWCAQIAANFPSIDLIDPLAKLLNKDDVDIRSATIISLGQINDERVTDIFQQTLHKEKDRGNRRLLNDYLKQRKTK